MQSALLLGLCLALVLVASIKADVDINRITATRIHQNLNRTSLPCTNFWSFACGGFSNNNNTETSKYVDNFEWVEDQFATALVEFMESDLGANDTQAPRLIHQMRTYYKACTRDKEQWTPLDPPETIERWARAGTGPLGIAFDERADVATNDSARRVVQLTMPDPRARFRMLRALQIIERQQNSYENKDNLTQFIKDLQELQDKHRGDDPTVYTWTYEEMFEQIPHLSWAEILSDLFEVHRSSPLFSNLIFEVSNVEYFRELVQLLRFVKFEDYKEYARVHHLVVLQEAAPRNRNPKTCIHHMRAILPLGMNYIYDRFVYQNREQDTRRLQEIFGRLKATFKKYLEANRLDLSAGMLDYLEAKLEGMQLKVGNLPEEKAPEFYDSHYESADFKDSTFVDNLIEALALRTRLQHAGLLQPNARLDLRRYYVNDNVVKARTSPFYENERNTITVPMEFLQFPLFDHRQHPIFQESLVGAVLAHEMSHAFEQEGVLFDASGNESPIGLQILESKNFQAAIECAKGEQAAVSLKERLADLNGLQLAYDSFFGLNHDSRQLEYRPYAFEAEFRAPQLFHLSYAQFFCGSLPPVIAHDRDDERVNVSVGNLRQFAYDFQCPHQTSPAADSAPPSPPPPPAALCEMWRPRELSASKSAILQS
ncbi:hypothetical protein KR054_008481 [Drosophila jambulina]|nr:hypothetical protein KR054_008481 [Drosophila jambulina]